MSMKKKSKHLTAKERQAFVEELLVAVVALHLGQAMVRSAVTPRHLARRLHVRTATVQRWLRGENLTLKTVARLFDALDCELRVRLGPPVRTKLQQDTTQRYRAGVTTAGEWVKVETKAARNARTRRRDPLAMWRSNPDERWNWMLNS